MREKGPEFQTNIERKNIRVTHEIGRSAVLFDLINTNLYEHPEEYRQFDHIYLRSDNGRTASYLFREDFSELYDELDRKNFTKMRNAYPSEADEKVWLDLQDKRLQGDIGTFEKEGYDE